MVPWLVLWRHTRPGSARPGSSIQRPLPWVSTGIGLAVVLQVSCGNVSPPPFELTRVQPATVRNTVETKAVVEGKQFYNALKVRLDDREAAVINRGWDVWVGTVELSRTQTSRIDANSLAIVLPVGLPIGTHDLTVTDPKGQTRKLDQAVTVVAGNTTAGTTVAGTGGAPSQSNGGNTGYNTLIASGGAETAGGTSGATSSGATNPTSGGAAAAGGVTSSFGGGSADVTSGGTRAVIDTVNTTSSRADAGPLPFCDPNDSSLVGCYRFESTMQPGKDDSGYGNHATASGVTLVAGYDGNSIRLTRLSQVQVAKSPSIDIPFATIEMWIRPDAAPVGSRAGLLDNEGQYGFFVQKSGALWCSMTTPAGNYSAQTTAVVSWLVWTHVACTYDGTNIQIFINGVAQASTALVGVLSSAGTTGASVGSNNPSGENFVGLMDDLRIWNVARTADQVCAAAHACTR